jgi:hypothetical protein
MNNNFDELIFKRRARGRVQTASMGAHVSWGAKGGRERLGGADGGRMGRKRPWGANVGARGGANMGARTAVGRARPRGDHGNGAPMCTPPVGGAYGARTAAATWFVGARTYAPSNGGA